MMKIHFLILVALVYFNSEAVSQCDGNYIFYQQNDLDQFFTTNASCTSVDSIWIEIGQPGMPDPITDLSVLSNLTSIQFLSLINTSGESYDYSPLNNLTSLDELQTSMVDDFSFCANITSMDRLLIDFNFNSNIYGLTFDLGGFDNLVSVGEIFLGINDPTMNLTNIFPSLVTIDRLDAFHWMFSNEESIWVNTLDGFHQVQNANLVSLGTYNNFFCTNFSIMNQITSIDVIAIDGQIQNFNAFTNLNEVHTLNHVLSSPTLVYPQLQSIDQGIFYFERSTTYSFPVLENVRRFLLQDQAEENDQIINLNMPMLHKIDSLQMINYGSYPTNYEWNMQVPLLDSITHQLSIYGMLIPNLDFLSSLEFIGGQLAISDNLYLTDCSIDALCSRLNDNIADVYILNESGNCESIAAVQAACDAPAINGQVYFDLDCNQMFDNGDFPLVNPLILNDNQTILNTGSSNGFYEFPLTNSSEFTFYPTQPVGTLPITPYTLTGDTVSADMTINFGLCPVVGYTGVEISCSQITAARPGFITTYELNLLNNSVNQESAIVTFNLSLFDGYPAFTSSHTFSIVGNELVFDAITLNAFEAISIQISGTLDATTPFGTPAIALASVTISNTDQDLSNNTSQVNGIVVASYDPNDIMVNLPLIDIEQADVNGDWLTYRIRFQNTGNFPADFINVVSEQDELVDMSTIQMIDASHSNVWSFDGREVTWFFENIQLPDSTSDPEGSQGYIIYKVRTLPGLGVGDLLEVNAAIYFDYNEPVITNSATTEYYLCPEALTIQNNTPVICENEIASLSASDGYDTYSWTFGEQELSTSQTLNYAAISSGSYTISCHATGTPNVCQSSATIDIQVNATPAMPVISQDQNTLTATGTGTFVWTLDGELLNETSNTLEITQTGNYSIYIDGICPSEVASGTYAYVGVEDINTIEIRMYPNPANEVIYLQNASLRSSIDILDMTGRICMATTANSNLVEIPIDALASGTYMIRVASQNHVWSESFIKE
jgi:hypothetical protein